jgi:HEAT repeat protein
MSALLIALALACPPAPVAAAAANVVQDQGGVSRERVEAALAALASAAKGGDAEAQAAAIRQSVDAVDARVVEAIAKELGSKHAPVAEAAIDTLGRMRDPASTRALTGHYKSHKKALTDDEPRLAELLKAIGRLGDPKGVETLTDSPFAAKTYPVVKARILGLGNIRDASAIEGLVELASKVGVRDLENYMADIRLALVQLTGQDQGDDPRQWGTWWRDAKKGYAVSPEPKPLPAEMRVRWNEYWGIQEREPERTGG